MQGIGTQSWDAGFIVQALLATNLIDEFGPTLAKAHDFIKKSQVITTYHNNLRKKTLTSTNFIYIV